MKFFKKKVEEVKRETYLHDTNCKNCGSYVGYHIGFGISVKEFFKTNKYRDCGYCGCKSK